MIKNLITTLLLFCTILVITQADAITRNPASRHWENAFFGGAGTFPMILPDIEIPNQVYMASDVAGLMKTVDAGENWTYMNSGTTSIINANIAQSEYNPDIMYSLGKKLLKSINRGRSWTAVADFSGTRSDIYKTIAIDRNNPNIVYVGLDDASIRKTTDGGLTWENYVTPFANVAIAQTTQVNCSSVAGLWNTTTSSCSRIRPSFLYINRTSTYMIVGSLKAGMIRYDLLTGAPTTITLTGTNALFNRDYGTYQSGVIEYICVTAGLKIACSADSGSTWTYTSSVSTNTLYFINRFAVTPTTTASSFPSTTILDNFNRANEGPPPSASWDGSLTVVTNSATNDTAGPGTDDAFWDVGTFGPDSEAYVTILLQNDDEAGRVYVRIDGSGNYGYNVQWNSFYDTVIINYHDAVGDEFQLGATINQTISNGDSIGISAVGNVITAYYKVSGGAWVAIGSRTDSTTSTAGKIGFDLYQGGSGSTLDDFGGGTVNTTAANKFFVHTRQISTQYGETGNLLSNNSGSTWVDVSRNVTRNTIDNPQGIWASFGNLGNVQSIASDSFNENNWYITTDATVLKSTDGGLNWVEKVKGAQNTVVTDCAVSPNGILFCSGMDIGLHKSIDNGDNWQAVLPHTSNDDPQGFGVAGFYWEIAILGTEAEWNAGTGTIIVTSSYWADFKPRVAISIDNGITWTIITTGLPTTLLNSNAGATDPNKAAWGNGYPRALACSADGAVCYLGIDGYSATENGGIFYSLDKGFTWVRTTQPPSWKVYNGIAVDPTDSTGNTVIFSEWFQASPTLPKTYKSIDRGTTWTVVSSNIGDFDMAYNSLGNVFKVGLNTNPHIDYSTNGDSGTWASMHNMNATNQVADGLYVDPLNPDRVFVGVNDGTNTGPTTTIGSGGGNSSGTTIIGSSIYVTNNAQAFSQADWTDLTGDLPCPAGVQAMTVNPVTNYLFVATDGCGVFRLNLDETTSTTLTNIDLGI